jgi:hypothetical protein
MWHLGFPNDFRMNIKKIYRTLLGKRMNFFSLCFWGFVDLGAFSFYREISNQSGGQQLPKSTSKSANQKNIL